MPPIYQNPVEVLQNLIRANTTNPPGNEVQAITYIATLLNDAGIETTILARDPNRPNLIARIKGEGIAPPLLLYGHVDVVTTENQEWQYPPFSGELVDGYVWGRGALDMKGGVAMLVCAFLRAKAENLRLPMDLVLCFVSDEEAGGDYGAKFLIEQHADQFANIRHAIGEFGGFSMQIGSTTFYPIGVAEKQVCSIRARVRGAGGHGATPTRGGAMAKLGKLLTKLDENRLPVHITEPVRMALEATAAALPQEEGQLLLNLLDPAKTDAILDAMGEMGKQYDGLLHNTANPTIVRGGSKLNVVPSEITVEMDGRLLPALKPEDMLRELRDLAGDVAEFEVTQYDPGIDRIDMSLFDTLGGVIKELDPNGVPVPLVLRGVTDGRFFGRLGIQTYGFLPMTLPPELNFTGLVHGANERIPVAALEFGVDGVYRAIQRVGELHK